jgi:hypothetical protein
MKLPRRLMRILIASFGTVYLAGTLYWLSRLFLKREGEFGPEPHWLEGLAGPIHVVAAFLFVFVMGMIWVQHIAPALKLKKHRWSGWLLLALMGGMMATGVTILYASEFGMKLAGQIHPWIGQALLATLLFHAFAHTVRRARASRASAIAKTRATGSN